MESLKKITSSKEKLDFLNKKSVMIRGGFGISLTTITQK
jgi:hypothetical protein